MPNPDGTWTIDEALAGGNEPKFLSIDEALQTPPDMGPAPKKYALVGSAAAEIDYDHSGLQSGERRLLANFGGGAKMQAAFLKSRGYQTTWHPDTGELLVVNQDGKARPLQGAADFADPLNYVVDAGLMMAGGLGGKIGGNLIPKSVLLGMLPGQVAGVATVRGTQQGVGQLYGANEIDPAAIAKESAAFYGLGATTYGGAQLFGRGGGVPKKIIAESVQRPGLTRPPPEAAERTLSEQLSTNAELQAERPTFGHTAYQQEFLGPLSGATLDVKSYADIIRSKITGGDHPSIRAADRALEALANRLEGKAIRNAPEISQIGQSRYSFPVGRFSQQPSESAVMGRYLIDKPLPPTSSGRMKAGDVDAWIRENLTDPLHGAYSRGSEAILANRLMEIRGAMSERLYASLGPGASSAQKMAEASLTRREAVEKTFPAFDKGGKIPVSTGAERLRMVIDPGPTGQTLRQVLQTYDAEHGTDFFRQASDLGIKRMWTAADQVKAQVIDNMLKPQYLRLGVIKQASRIIGKRIVRGTGQVIPTLAGSGALGKRPKKDAETEETAP